MHKLAILFMAVMMTGCSSFDSRTFTGLNTKLADSRLGTKIYTHTSCPSEMTAERVNEEIKGGEGVLPLVAAPLIAAGVSLAATFIVNSIDKAIDEYKKGLSGSFGAAGTAKGIPKKKTCVIIARGLMGQMEKPLEYTPEEIAKISKAKAAKEDAEEYDFLVKYSYVLGLKSYPAFYLELKASIDEPREVDKNPGPGKVEIPGALTLTPQYLSYAASAAKNWGWSKTKHVGLALAFSDMAQKKPDEINEEKTFANFRHDFGRLEIGKRYNTALLAGTDASVPLTKDQFSKPAFNITAVVSDSEDPGIIFQVLQQTFTSEKEGLQTALEEVITNAIKKTQPPSPK